MQLMILGMHRSGTSALTRVLNLMGAYFGIEGISTGANAENKRGFWERQDVRKLNDRVLHSMEKDWNKVFQLDLESLKPDVAAYFDNETRKLIMGMDGHRPWVMKEPRFCLLYPLWRKHLEVPVAILPERNPLEVAASLKKRNQIPLNVGLALWEQYVRSAIYHSQNDPRIVVHHRRLISEPMDVIADLKAQLEAHGVEGLRMPTKREIEAFIDPSLHRERFDDDFTRKHLTPCQRELWDALINEQLDLFNESPQLSLLTQELLEQYERDLGAHAEAKAMGAQLETLKQERANLEQHKQELEKNHQQAESKNKTVFESLTQKLGRLQNELLELQRKEQEFGKAKEQIEHLEKKLEQSRQVQRELEAKVKSQSDSQTQGKQQVESLEALQNDLDSERDTCLSYKTKVKEWELKHNHLEQQYQETLTQLNATRDQHKETVEKYAEQQASLVGERQKMQVLEREHRKIIELLEAEIGKNQKAPALQHQGLEHILQAHKQASNSWEKQMATLERLLQREQDKHDHLLKQYHQMMRDLEKHRSLSHEATQDLSQKTEELEAVQTQLLERKVSVDKLQDELDQKVTLIHQLEQQIKQVEATQQSPQATAKKDNETQADPKVFEQFKAKQSQLAKDLTTHQGKMDHWNQQLDKQKQQLANLKRETEHLNKQVQAAQKDCQNLEQQLAQVNHSLNQQKAEKERAQASVRKLEHKIAKLSADIREQTYAIQTRDRIMGEREAVYKQLEHKYKALLATYEGIKASNLWKFGIVVDKMRNVLTFGMLRKTPTQDALPGQPQSSQFQPPASSVSLPSAAKPMVASANTTTKPNPGQQKDARSMVSPAQSRGAVETKAGSGNLVSPQINDQDAAFNEIENQLNALAKEKAQSDSELKQLADRYRSLEAEYNNLLSSRLWKVGGVAYRVEQKIKQAFKKVNLVPSNQGKASKRPEEISAERLAEAELIQPAKQGSIGMIVLNLNGAHHLRNLFSSFKQYNTYPNYEFLVVDHASNDDSIAVCEQYQGDLNIKILARDQNYTFSFSNNRAAEETDAEYVMLLNNDIIFDHDVLGTLVAELESDDVVGAVGARLFYPKNHAKKPGEAQHMGIQFFLDDMERDNAGLYFARYADVKKSNYGKSYRGARNHFEEHGKRQNRIYEDLSFIRPYNIVGNPQAGNFFPCVTGAALLCRREDYLAIGGLYEGYNYGYEDVDFGLLMLAALGKKCMLSERAEMIHDESATQLKDPGHTVRDRRLANRATLKARFGRSVKQAYFLDILEQKGFWTRDRLVIAFAVTEADPNTKAGDYFTAMELADACKQELGWEVRYVARNKDWYDMRGVDVLVSLLDAYDLSKIHHARPSLVTIAWARNWFQRWAERPSFDNYDIYVCSSKKAADYWRDHFGKHVFVLPIATNAEKFTQAVEDSKYASDYCFTGSYWKADRDIEQMLDPSAFDYDFALFGGGWDNHKNFKKYWRGFVPYADMPAIYASTKMVIDDANHVTKPWGSVNSRVFDALANGKLVITNGTDGVRDLFGDHFPTYESKEEMHTLVAKYLGDDEARKTLSERLHKEVLEHHTYRQRAHQLKDILKTFYTEKYRIAIKIPVPKWEVAHEWGDYHFALALKRSFERQGHSVRLDILPDWYKPGEFGDDVVLVLRGLSKYEPKPHNINLMWNISHPDKIEDDEYNLYDHVFIASKSYAETLSRRLTTSVSCLLQCTDPNLFYPDYNSEVPYEKLLFVGNSRRQYRKIVRLCVEQNQPVSVYGNMWDNLIPNSYIKAKHIPNDQLRQYYSKCGVLLNDHWPTMAEYGFISNRLFDGAACGACILSDHVLGVEDVFGEHMITFQRDLDFPKRLKSLLKDKKKRQEIGNTLREIVINGHTFDHRADTILEVVDKHPKNHGFKPENLRASNGEVLEPVLSQS